MHRQQMLSKIQITQVVKRIIYKYKLPFTTTLVLCKRTNFHIPKCNRTAFSTTALIFARSSSLRRVSSASTSAEK